MRNKFSDLIKDGVASFEYTNLAQETPCMDGLCRIYNNIFSIPSDTHMNMLEDGTRVITGHMINTPQWDKFICSPNWGGIRFGDAVNSGYWSAACLFSGFGLCGARESLNGEVVYVLRDCRYESHPELPHHATTSESNIPQPLTLCGDVIRLQEYYKHSENLQEVAQKMNESLYIKGNNWCCYNDKIYGLLNNKVYIL